MPVRFVAFELQNKFVANVWQSVVKFHISISKTQKVMKCRTMIKVYK